MRVHLMPHTHISWTSPSSILSAGYCAFQTQTSIILCVGVCLCYVSGLDYIIVYEVPGRS